MDVQKDGQRCPSNVVAAVVELATSAFAHSKNMAGVDSDDLEHLVVALHVMRPSLAELSFFDGWLHLVRNEWSEAELVFRDLVERSICLPGSRGMLLQCLKEQQAYGWQDEAQSIVEEGVDDEVTRLARVLLAGEDMKQAVSSARRTGRFVTPESVIALKNGAHGGGGEPAAAPSPMMGDMLLTMQYLRI